MKSASVRVSIFAMAVIASSGDLNCDASRGAFVRNAARALHSCCASWGEDMERGSAIFEVQKKGRREANISLEQPQDIGNYLGWSVSCGERWASRRICWTFAKSLRLIIVITSRTSAARPISQLPHISIKVSALDAPTTPDSLPCFQLFRVDRLAQMSG